MLYFSQSNCIFFHSQDGQYLASRLYHIFYFIISNYPGKSCFYFQLYFNLSRICTDKGLVFIQILRLTQGENCMANKEYKSDANLSLYEHQSTYCPNMPLRDLLYFASIIQKRIKAQKRDIYGGKILKIPVPHFVVFYNGKEEAPEQYDLRLSDVFEQETEHPEIELVCRVYNINKGKNAQLLSKCRTLREYMYFVDRVRKNNEISGNLEDAIRQAIDHCIEEDVLRDFLDEHREEVMHVTTLDYTFERRLEMQRAEAIEDGEKIGRKEQLSELIQKKILKNKPLDQIADELEESPETIRPLYEKIRQEMQQ